MYIIYVYILDPHLRDYKKASLLFTISWHLLNWCPLNQWYHSIASSSVTPPPLLPSIFPSITVFSMCQLFTKWPRHWGFSFSVSPSNVYSGLIYFRIDWFDLLTVQGTLKSLLQHHSSKASILQCSAFFMIQLSHPHMTTGKTIALTSNVFDF